MYIIIYMCMCIYINIYTQGVQKVNELIKYLEK